MVPPVGSALGVLVPAAAVVVSALRDPGRVVWDLGE